MKKQKIIFALVGILIFYGVIGHIINAGAQKDLKSAADPQIKVVATTTILRDFSQQIIGDKGSVSVIIEGGMCPGHYDYTPSDINLVSDADIVLYYGFEWNQFLQELLTAADNTDAAYSISVDGGLGWTQWGSPGNAPLFLDVICTHLNNTYPILNETFNQNCDNFKAHISTKKAEIEAQNALYYNFTDVKAYIMKHQTAFMSWLGFNITGDWDKDDNSMTPSDFDAIIDGAYETGAEIIVMNYQSGTDIGKEAADYLGIPSVPLLNFPGVYGIQTYLEQLDFNIALLNWALNNGADPRTSSNEIGLDLWIPFTTFALIGILLIIYMRSRNIKAQIRN